MCEQHSSASQLPESQPGWLCCHCGDECIPEGLQGDSSRLFLKTCLCRVDFFPGCCETALSAHLISELLVCPAPPGALCPLPGCFPGLFVCALLSCSPGRVVPEQCELGRISAGQCWNALCPWGVVDCGPLGGYVCSDLVSCSSGDIQYLDVPWLWSPLWPLTT